MARKTTKKETTMTETTIVAFKGFDQNLQCRGFQYEFGKTYKHDGDVEVCKGGFHACKHPLNVFAYYPPAQSRYAEVALDGKTAREEGSDTKIAAAKITINVELTIGELVKRAWDYVWSRATLEEGSQATGYHGAASATGDQGAASATGYHGAASATGNQGAAMSSGYEGRVQAAKGNALFLVERDDDLNIVAVWAGIAGRDGIKPLTWYTLRDGKPVEVG